MGYWELGGCRGDTGEEGWGTLGALGRKVEGH